MVARPGPIRVYRNFGSMTKKTVFSGSIRRTMRAFHRGRRAMGRSAGLRLSILIGIGSALAAVAGAQAQSLPAVLGDEWQAPAEHRARFNPLSPTPDTLRRGRSLYFQNCVLCHGDKGQ